VKKVVTVALLAFVAGSAVFWVVKETGTVPGASEAAPSAAPASSGSPAAPARPHQVVAYYFHGQKRCNTCRAIQAQSREAIEAAFPEALMSGVLEFREVNTEEPGNDHFVTDYDLAGSSLVLVEFREGRPSRFKNLQKVWDLWADKPAFLAYVVDETRPWLEAP
jgi:hypothetical protein